MPHNGSRAAAHVYVQGGYNGTDLANEFEFCGLDHAPAAGPPARVYTDGNGFISPPPSPSSWWQTNQLRAYGDNNTIWVLTWDGTCNPDFWVAEMGGPGNMRLATAQEVTQYAPGLPPANANRRYYIVTGVTIPSRSDVPEPNFSATYVGKSGEYGFSYLVGIRFKNQTTPIGNIRWYNAKYEADIQAGRYANSEWVAQAQGFGLLRFMDMCDPMAWPSAADVAQFAPPGVDPKMYRSKVITGTPAQPYATKLGFNYYEIPVRSDKPTPTDKMVLACALPEPVQYYRCKAYKTGSTSPQGVVPAGKTYFVVENVGSYEGATVVGAPHELANGDVIQIVTDWWYGGGWTPGPELGITPLRNAYAVTVITTTVFSIDVDTSASGVSVPKDQVVLKTPRIRYGGQTHYITAGRGVEPNSSGDGLSFRRNMTLQFLVPWGREAQAATYGAWYAGGGAAVYPHPKRFTDLANNAGSHCWYCIPPFATDEMIDFICNWFIDNLAPGLQLWLELGNEIWNYPPHREPLVQIAELGLLTKPNGQVTGTGGWWKTGFSIRNRYIHKRAKTLFASRGAPDKLRTVFGFQQYVGGEDSSLTYGINPQLNLGDWFSTGDQPGNYADVLAVAPYYAPAMHYNSRADLENFPGWKEAIWKYKQGGALRVEAFDWFRRQSMYSAETPAGWFSNGSRPGDYFFQPGLRKGVSLAADGDWTTAATQWNAKLALYEWNSDWWPETIGSVFARYAGSGHPATQTLVDLRDGDTYEDTATQTVYQKNWNGWSAIKTNFSSVVNGSPTTRKDVLGFCLDYLYSDARAQEVIQYLEWWHSAHPNHTYGCLFTVNNAYKWRQIFTFWPSGVAAQRAEVPKSIAAVRAWGLGGMTRDAYLYGRGYLTATAKSAKGAGGTLNGRGSLAATGTKSAQVFYGLSNYAENAVLDFLLRATGTSPTTVYLALHTGNTGEDGTTNEVSTSTGYARTAITFDAPSGGQIVSAAQVAFGPFSSAPGQITNFSIWTAASGGNCLATGAFTSSASPLSGYSLNVPAGGIQITAN